MSDPESRIIGFGIAGSVAVHLLAALTFACWVAFAPAPVMKPHPSDPPVEVILPENIQLVATPTPAPPPEPEPKPEPPKPKPKPVERYIRTTQNEEEAAAPKKVDFVSDRNTTAMARLAPEAGATEPMPTTKGVKIPTQELENREFKDGKIKDDSAPVPASLPPPLPVPPKKQEPEKPVEKPVEKSVTEPPPPEKMAKKEDAPAEKMMKELDAALLKDSADKPPEVPKAKPVDPTEKTPLMKLPDEPPVPQTVPTPPPTPQPPKPEKEAFMPQTRTSAAKGLTSNRGSHDAVDAASTPAGRYMRKIQAAIEKRWNFYRLRNGDFIDPCNLVLHFTVDKNGKTSDVKIVLNKANVRFTDFSITSVLEAEIPPIPSDLMDLLENGRFEMDYEFLIY